MKEVQTVDFFVVDGPASKDLRDAVRSSDLGLPQSYKAFVLRFGNARLYRAQAGYALGVLAAPIRAEMPEGEELLRFGYYQSRRAYFKLSLLVADGDSPVFESQSSGLIQVASGFDEWLEKRAARIRRSLGKQGWARAVAGPPPFSAREREIVAARKLFRWKVIGLSPGGNVRFEIANGSATVLPYLTIGVRHRRGDLVGAVHVPVSELQPGSAACYEVECYKKYVPESELEIFAKADPTPADRRRYWEFRSLNIQQRWPL